MATSFAYLPGSVSTWDDDYLAGMDNWFDFSALTLPDDSMPSMEYATSSKACSTNGDVSAFWKDVPTDPAPYIHPSSAEILSADSNRNAKRLRTQSSDEDMCPARLGLRAPKRFRLRFTHAQTKVLETWFESHQDFPYPDKNEKIYLASVSGLTKRQVETWFTKCRKKRHLMACNHEQVLLPRKFAECDDADHIHQLNGLVQQEAQNGIKTNSTRSLQSSLAVVLSPLCSDLDAEVSDSPSWDSGSEDRTCKADGHNHQPLSHSEDTFIQWWLNSLHSEDEEVGARDGVDPATPRPIEPSSPSQLEFELESDDAARGTDCFATGDALRYQGQPFRRHLIFTPLTSQVHPDNNSMSATSTERASSYSTQSDTSSCSYVSFGSRQGRKYPYRKGQRLERRDTSTASHEFQCTFCGDGFESKFTWRRHEETIHVPPAAWICRQLPLWQKSPFLETDNDKCWRRPLAQRTFFLKDGFVQHLKGSAHKLGEAVKTIDLSIFAVESNLRLQNLTCGFCNHENAAWVDRVNHVARHFVEDGLDISQWKGTNIDALTYELVPPCPLELEATSAAEAEGPTSDRSQLNSVSSPSSFGSLWDESSEHQMSSPSRRWRKLLEIISRKYRR